MIKIEKEGLAFDDVLMIPGYSNVASRSDLSIDISTHITNRIKLQVPIVTANMDTVTNKQVAIAAHQAGGIGIIHRFQNPEDQADELFELGNEVPAITCLGVGHGALARLSKVLEVLGVSISSTMNTVLIDIAHGDCQQMVETIKKIKKRHPDIDVIAGNVCTVSGALRLVEAGACTIKVGIGGGALCSTRINTGFGYPQLSAISNIADAFHQLNQPTYLIADGGIRNGGDIMKAIAVGADAVMVGSLIAGAPETPGNIFQSKGGQLYKTYRGMASKEAQLSWKKSFSSVEGEAIQTPLKMPVRDIIDSLKGNLLSSMTYGGGCRTLKEFRENVRFVKQTNSGLKESVPHGVV